jgi:hypothetical protein
MNVTTNPEMNVTRAMANNMGVGRHAASNLTLRFRSVFTLDPISNFRHSISKVLHSDRDLGEVTQHASTL